MHFILIFSYKNRPKMSFDDTGQHCDEEFDLQPDYIGELEYNTKYVLLFPVSKLEYLSARQDHMKS